MTRFADRRHFNQAGAQDGEESDPVIPSVLETTANNLESALDALAFQVDQLGGRLQPLLLPEPTTGEAKLQGEVPPRPRVSPFVLRLQSQADRVDHLTQALEHLRKQLQV